MAEVVGLVAAAGQFVEQSIKIIKLSKALYDKVQDAPEELKGWGQEIEEVQKVVISIENAPALRRSDTAKATIDHCNSVSNELRTLFKELEFEETDALGRKTWKAVGGLAKEPEIRRLFEEIERQKSTLNTQIAVANLNQGYETNTQLKELKSFNQPGTEADQCLKDLFVTDPVSDREGIITAKGHRTPGTCEWITTTAEYQTWEASQSDLLWISGPPGKGKTIISVYLTQLLEISKPDATIIYFFCDNKVAARNSSANLLRGLMYQLILRHNSLVSYVLPQWKVQGESLFQGNSFESLWRIFQKMLESLEGHVVYCILDALDECDASSLSRLLFKLKALFRADSVTHINQNLKLVVLSREHPQCLPKTLSELPHIQVDKEKHDIRLYISEQAASLAASKGIEGSDLHRHIEKTFLEKSEGTFLWVSFMVQDLETKTIDQIEASLAQLPQGLYAVYERILSQIQPGNWDAIFEMLVWLTLAARPLTVGEICEATHIKPTQALSPDQVCMGYIKSCGHLLQLSTHVMEMAVAMETRLAFWTEMDHRGHTGEQNSPRNFNINFVHQSAKDFLLDQDKSTNMAKYTVNSKKGHMVITNSLIQYLYNGCLRAELQEVRREYQLYDYSMRQWDYHMRHVGDDCSRVVNGHKDFFGKASRFRAEWYSRISYGLDDDIPVLHMASEFGLYYLAKRSLQKRSILFGLGRRKEVNRKWGDGDNTPLHLAVQGQHEQLVGLLLEHGADPSRKNESGYTALHEAVIYKAYGVFDMLLATEKSRKVMYAEAALSSTNEASLLHLAAENGDEALCCDLIEKYGYNTEMTCQGKTPLIPVVENLHVGLARTLVERYGAKTESHYRLMRAAASSDPTAGPDLEQTFQLFAKEWGVDFNATNDDGNTALWAVVSGPEHLKRFMKFGCDPGWRNSAGETVLYHKLPGKYMYASLGVILQDGRLDINNRNTLGQTVLHFVSNLKHQYPHLLEDHRLQYVTVLLDFGADRSIRDADGRLPSDITSKSLETVRSRLRDDKRSVSTQSTSDISFDAEAECEFLESIIDVLENYSTVPRDPTVVPLRLERSKKTVPSGPRADHVLFH